MQIKHLAILKTANGIRSDEPHLALVKYEAVLENVWDELNDTDRWLIIELLSHTVEEKLRRE